MDVFDRYNKLSFKPGTRNRRSRGAPIRRNIETFLYLMIGKALFLSEEIIQRAPVDTIVVVGVDSCLKNMLSAMTLQLTSHN